MKILEARVHKYTSVHFFVVYGLCCCKLHADILHRLEVTTYFNSYYYFFYYFYHFFVLYYFFYFFYYYFSYYYYYYYYYYFLRANSYMLTPSHHCRYRYGVR